MPKSIRIRTEPGVDRNINVKIDQDFDSLEILSLKLRQEDLYTQFCADYGVVVGRVIANGGLGIPNAHISIFIPLDSVDENDPIISTLYPYKTPTAKNEDGYRYNLLPYENEYYGHNATGTFPTVDDVLTRKEVLQVYEKYYKYSVRTNQSGDFMIVGVPLGIQKIIMDLDLSNMGEFSLRPSDLIRMGRGVSPQFNGQLFKDSEDIGSLPQIVNEIKDIDVSSFWGQDEMCDVGITRVDFDLADQGIEITPHSIFMGSITSSNDDEYIRATCRPKKDTGNLCDMVAGPGEILAIRHTIQEDINGDPVLEQYQLEDGGNVIDDNGAWLVDLPMNLDYITTNEFGERVVSVDPTIGVPTKSKYRFKVKWQNEAGLQTQIMRANYLIPNIREHWTKPPANSDATNAENLNKSYSFSLDWNDYYDKDAAIKCEDTFYLFAYNKVYTTAAHIDRWKYGFSRASHYGIKEILDKSCASETNRFPINDGQRNFDFLYFLFNILITVVTPVIIVILPIMHVLALLYPIFRIIINLVVWIINKLVYAVCKVVAWLSRKLKKSDCKKESITPLAKENPFKRLTLPMITYPDCEACSCQDVDLPPAESETLDDASFIISNNNESNLSDIVSYAYDTIYCNDSSSPNECDSCYGGETDGNRPANEYNGVMFSGYDPEIPASELNGSYDNPPATWYKSPYSLQRSPATSHTVLHTSFPQSVNLMNQRERYFNDLSNGDPNLMPNRMRVDVLNNQLSTSGVPQPPVNSNQNRYEDMPLILLMDGNVSIDNGQLMTMVDSDLILDPNVSNSGLTVNQYGTQSITGTMAFNTSSYVQAPCSYIGPNGTAVNANLDLYSPVQGQSYNFKTGIEYYQCIGGMSITEAKHFLTGNTQYQSTSILWNYFIDKHTEYFCTPDNNPANGTVFPRRAIDDFIDGDNIQIYFLARGVDPYSPRQTLKYDLSKLFGYGGYGQNPDFEFTGEYFPNIPIQPVSSSNADYLCPEDHYSNLQAYQYFQNVPNNNNTTLFHGSYLFTPDVNQFTGFTTSGFAYYSSLGETWGSYFHSNYGSPNGMDADTIPNGFSDGAGFEIMSISNSPGTEGQGRVDGASYQWTNTQPTVFLGNFTNHHNYTVSPSYWLNNSVTAVAPTIGMNDSNQLVFRSDRLPTSSRRDTGTLGNSVGHLQDFPLHLNAVFSYFNISDTGQSVAVSPNQVVGNSDGTGASEDYSNDPDTTYLPPNLINSFSCNGLVVLDCYTGNGDNFGVDANCDDLDRTQGGCYVFVDNPLIVSLFTKDYPLFFEWRTRFRFMFGACRGVIGHMFQNNWINGTLYMPSFQKKTFYNSDNEVKRYKYCGDPQESSGGLLGTSKSNCGPLYFNTDSNSFFYRSAPYYQGNFKPQTPCNGGNLTFITSPGENEGNIWQPTTIMDLGPKTDFLKEILLTPEFQGYIIDEVESTSFQDISGILNLFVISRLVDASFLENLLGVGDAAIQKLFSRNPGGGLLNRFFDSRVDGDYAQMTSINTEFGVLPYLTGNYADDISVSDGLMGIWFTGNTKSVYNDVGSTVEDRRILGPGQLTFSENPFLTNQFNYDGTQVVPFYTWKYENSSSIWGTEENTWKTSSCESDTYQDAQFDAPNLYPKPQTGLGTGFIFNRPTNTFPGLPPASSKTLQYRVGSPFQHYFGLKKGKSAMNRFITKFMFNADLNG